MLEAQWRQEEWAEENTWRRNGGGVGKTVVAGATWKASWVSELYIRQHVEIWLDEVEYSRQVKLNYITPVCLHVTSDKPLSPVAES